MDSDITLNQFESDEISSLGVISSGGLGPCIAIGIYDKTLKHGYMIHESNAYHHNNISDFIDKVLSKSYKNNLKIYVTGGGLGFDDEDEKCVNESIIQSRNFVVQELKKHFNKKQITIKWNKSIETSELFLDTSNGKFFIERAKNFSNYFKAKPI